MSIDIGIIGLPQSGKTTVFNALTGGRVDAKGRSAEGQASHIGIAKVPEPRLKILEEMFHAKKVVTVEARYLDVSAPVKSLFQDKGIGGELLNQICNTDAIISVVRAFADESIPHPEGSIDARRDMATLNLELVFSDLAIIERRMEKLENSLKSAKPAERQGIVKEQEILTRFKTCLEEDTPIRELSLDAGESKIVANYQLLTAKPLLTVVNIGEDQLSETSRIEDELKPLCSGEKSRVVTLCGKLEKELATMDEAEVGEFRSDFGLEESGLERTIKISYELLGLITYLTAGPNEVRAWSIKKGTTALKAAGKIHSDLEKGFIRAETISLDELVKCGSINEARKQGRLRLEGKEYIIRDGDVITFLFNV